MENRIKYNPNRICLICTYNGQRYISDQVASILIQFGDDDIVVVSDDCSHDQTVKTVESIADHRIVVLKSNINRGYVKNFEYGLKYIAQNFGHLENSLIYLSDQDDVWFNNKVERVELEINSGAVYVAHDLTYVDFKMKPLENQSKFFQYNRFYPLQGLIKPKAFGCTQVFKVGMLKRLLPFPTCAYTHDHWIELVATAHGKCSYIMEPLTYYRRLKSSLTVLEIDQKKYFWCRMSSVLKYRLFYLVMIFMSRARYMLRR